MEAVHAFIENNVVVAFFVLAIAFVILSKCADMFVESAVGIARKIDVPKLVIGIVLVSLATTAPELSVSLLSAIRGQPEMALGNAIGSVICDDGLALAMAGIFSASAIMVMPRVLKTSGVFLLFIQLVIFFCLVFDLTLSRWEGALLVTLFVGYLFMLFYQHRKGLLTEDVDEIVEEALAHTPVWKLIALFLIGLTGIVVSSEFIITSATSVALFFMIPESIIALTLVALGTSIPEVATCIVAARKGEGAIAVGNIIGADIMNICWVAGASAIANDLVLSEKSMWFMFPSMFIIVITMLLLLRAGYRLTRTKGFILLGFYIIYLISFMVIFPNRTA